MNHDDINDMLDKAEPPFGAKHYCIFKTPLAIRRLYEDPYTPVVISIGPFHHRLSHVQNMGRHKLIFFKAFLQRAGTTTQPLIKYIESIIPDFRLCYSETLDFTDQELVKLILIDSGFIIELFYGFYHYEQHDHFLLKPSLGYRVTFKVNTKSKCLLDLRFSGGVFEIPELSFDDWTAILFRNMIALEQCYYPDESYITDYIFVLDFLINTGRDEDILVQKEIIVDWLGDSEVLASAFNGLSDNVITSHSNSDYSVICDNLDGFYRDPWHKLKATLRRDYGSTPWQTAASAAGILLLFLSLLQSVCSVLQIVQQ
ncbi:hypothetical protein P8452_57519 [Trifolium repens]|nr:hypothetical protein P8452_57519 [Trifolium repens]